VKLNDILDRMLQPSGDYVSGTADLAGLTGPKYTGFRYGISIGKRLDDGIIDTIRHGPTLEYYTLYRQVNEDLAALTEKIRVELHKINIDSVAIEPTFSAEESQMPRYLETLTVDLSHKMVATRAGLGWIGKTDLFISKKFGPRLRLVSLLLDKNPEKIGVPIGRSFCGICEICVQKCPAHAANGKPWNTHVHRDEFFDAHKCRAQCAEFGRERLGMDVRVCGICISVCPVGRTMPDAVYKLSVT
jgi:epoxyqueuosine reductase